MKGTFKSPSQAFFTPYSSKNAFYESVDMAKQCSCKSVNISSRERIKLFVKYQIGHDEWEPIMLSIFKDLPITELKRKLIQTLKSQIFNFQKPDQILLQFNGHRLPQSQIIENLLDSMSEIRATPLFSFNKRQITKNVASDVPESVNEATTQESQQTTKILAEKPLTVYSNHTKAKNYFNIFKKAEQEQKQQQESKKKLQSESNINESKIRSETLNNPKNKENILTRAQIDQKINQGKEQKVQNPKKEVKAQVTKKSQQTKEENESEEESESESSSQEESVEGQLEQAWGDKSSKVTEKQSVTSNEGSKRPRNLFV